MDTDLRFIALLCFLAASSEHPDPDCSPLSDIADLGDQAVPLLIEALTHDDPIIRRTAADALGQLRSLVDRSLDLQPAVPHLERMTETDPDPVARLNAAEAIWNVTGTKTVVPDFVEALSHEDVEVRCGAVSLIGLVEADLQDVLQPLVAALADPNPFVRGTAAEVLADHGAAAAEALPSLDRLLAEDEFTRVVVAHAILCIDPSRTEELVPVFAEALSSQHREVRIRAAQVLGEIPAAGALAIQSLIQALGDEEEIVRPAVLNTLQNLGASAAPAMTALVEFLAISNDLIERGLIADTLGTIGPAAEVAVPQLLKCLEEPGEVVARTFFRIKLASALWHISGEPDHLLALGLEAVGRPEWWLRWKAAMCLGELGLAAVPHLHRLLDDGHRTVRRAAAESLRRVEAAI